MPRPKSGEEFWIEEREDGDKLKSGFSVFGLRDSDPKHYPYVVMTRHSVSALGEMVAVCPTRLWADAIVGRLNGCKPKY